MNIKKILGVLLVLFAFGTVVAVAQQSWGWNLEGQQCYSYANVEYYYSTSDYKTHFWNHNDYGVTVLYTYGTSQSSLYIAAGAKKNVNGKVIINSCSAN